VAFSPDGARAVTGSDDDTLRLWNVENVGSSLRLEPTATLTGHQDNVRSAAFTPDGKYLLSGSDDKSIRLWDGKTGKFIKVLASQGSKISSLSISPDSKLVLTGHSGTIAERINHIFSIPDGKKLLSFTKHKNIVLATAISPDGKLAATGGGSDMEIYLWDIRSGNVKQRLAGKGKRIWSVGFGRDGRTVAWGKTFGQENLFEHGKLEQSFELTHPLSPPLFIKERGQAGEFIRGIESVGNISIRTKDGKIHPTLQILQNGEVKHEISRGSTDGYTHRSLTLTPDGKIAISGGESGVLTAYDTQNGSKLHDFIGHTGDVFGLAVSPDGKMLVSGSDNQTVKLWDIASGKNLLTIFQASDNEWVAWTPEGYYDSSVNGDKYIGWHINQGEDKSARYYPASQFADRFRKPLVVANYLKTNGNLDEAIRLANAEDPKKQKTEETSISQINKLLPPEVFFEQPSESDTESSEQIFCVKAGAKSLTDEPVKDIWLILNGKQDRGIKVKDKSAEPRKQLQGKEAIVEQCFELNRGENRISVSASAGQTSSEPETVRVIWKGKKSSDENDIYKPNLYLLSIGVSKYQNTKYNLDVADKDAEAIAHTASVKPQNLPGIVFSSLPHTIQYAKNIVNRFLG
jgi:WD40 repeat protein